jgi:hypothetical protein
MTDAESLTAKFAALSPGDVYAQLHATATAANTAEDTTARNELFSPELADVTKDTIEMYRFVTNRLVAQNYPAQLAHVCERALLSGSPVVWLCLSLEALCDVAECARRIAQPSDEHMTFQAAGDHAAKRAVEQYVFMIARLIAAVADHPRRAAAQRILDCAVRAELIAATRQKLEAHAAAEVARVLEEHGITTARAAAEQKAAADAAVAEAAAATKRRLEQLETDAREDRYRKADSFVARLKASRLTSLRIGHPADEKVYDAAHLIGNARSMTVDQLAVYERALDRAAAEKAV